MELRLRPDDDHAGGRIPRHAALHPRAAARLSQRRAAPEGDGARLPRPDGRLLPHERHGGVRVDPDERHARRLLLHSRHESAAQLSLPEVEGRASGLPVRQLFEQAAVLRLVGGRLREPDDARLHEGIREGLRGELRRGRHRVRLLPARTAVQDRRLGRVRDRGAAEAHDRLHAGAAGDHRGRRTAEGPADPRPRPHLRLARLREGAGHRRGGMAPPRGDGHLVGLRLLPARLSQAERGTRAQVRREVQFCPRRVARARGLPAAEDVQQALRPGDHAARPQHDRELRGGICGGDGRRVRRHLVLQPKLHGRHQQARSPRRRSASDERPRQSLFRPGARFRRVSSGKLGQGRRPFLRAPANRSGDDFQDSRRQTLCLRHRVRRRGLGAF